MGRLINVVGVAAAIAAAAGVYSLKHETGEAASHAARLKGEIGRERDAIAVLKAEWSHLNQPSRLKTLAEKYLELGPLEVNRLVRVEDVPLRNLELSPGERGAPLGAAATPASAR